MTDLKPLGDKLLVKRDKPPTNEGELAIVTENKTDLYSGIVISKGKGSQLHPLDNVNTGSVVIYPKNGNPKVPDELTEAIATEYGLEHDDVVDVVEFGSVIALDGGLRGERVISNRVVENKKGELLWTPKDTKDEKSYTGVVLAKGKSDSPSSLYDIVHVSDVILYHVNDCIPLTNQLKEVFNVKGEHIEFVDYHKIMGTI